MHTAPLPAPVPVAGARTPEVRNHAFELQIAERMIQRQLKTTTTRPDVAPGWVGLARAHLERAHLASGLEDDLAAQDAFAKAEALAPAAPAVLRMKAKLLQRRHHFAKALAVMEQLPNKTSSDLASMATIRFQLGDYKEALKVLEPLAHDPRDPQTPAQLAGCLWKLGRFDDAERWFKTSASRYHGRAQRPVAWTHLMLGLMDLDRGRLDAAMVHYRAADKVLPGWWLVEEHIAEIHLKKGEANQALPLYEEVVKATDNPELVAALADAHEALGNKEKAAELRSRALAGFDDLLKSQPDLAGTHALEFLLEHAPERALAVAKRNVELRPNGEAKLLLAQALEHAGKKEEAAALRDEVTRSGWWTES